MPTRENVLGEFFFAAINFLISSNPRPLCFPRRAGE